MQKLFRTLHDLLEAGTDTVLVTIVASSGSTPRGSGARMLVTAQGRVEGTVGGGAVEFESIKRAQLCLKHRSSAGAHYSLTRNEVADIGMICGGDVDVYFCCICGHDKYMCELTAEIDGLFERREQSWLVTQIAEENQSVSPWISVVKAGGEVLGRALPSEVTAAVGNKPIQVAAEQGTFYCEKLVQAGKVYIFGGGHVAQQLVPVLARCDFACEVVEDRPEFTLPELFEGVKATHLVQQEDIDEFTGRIGADDYVCIMTRGHKDDYMVQKAVLRTKACYIGVIGSRFKIAGVNAKLKEDGFAQEDIDRITTPIGLDIGSETPAEIAVSIAGQLIMVRARRNYDKESVY